MKTKLITAALVAFVMTMSQGQIKGPIIKTPGPIVKKDPAKDTGNQQKEMKKNPVKIHIPNSTKIKQIVSESFDYSGYKNIVKPGNIQSKWVKLNTANKELKINEKDLGNKNSNPVPDIICNTVTKKLDVTSGTFMNSTSDLMNSKIYPGAIYTGEDFLKGNYNREVKANRLPIKLKSSDPTLGKSKLVQNPSEDNINNTRIDMINDIADKTESKNLETKFRLFYSKNENMSQFKLGTGASGYGVSVKSNYNTKNASSSVTLTLDAYRSIYSIDAISDGDNVFFSELPPSIKNNSLMMVNSVAYGTRVIANITIKTRSSEDAISLAAAYSGYGFDANLDVGYLSKKTDQEITVNYKQVGGLYLEGTLTSNADQLQQKIDKILANVNYDNAIAISYNTRDLAGNNMGIQSTVDKYEETVCFKNLPIDKVFARIKSGKDGKNADNFLTMTLIDGDGYKVAEFKQNKNMEFKKDMWSNMLEFSDISKTANTSHFAKGGKLMVSVDHRNGKDDWYIDEVELLIQDTEGETLKPKNTVEGTRGIKWVIPPGGNKSIRFLRKDEPKTDLHFTKTFEGTP